MSGPEDAPRAANLVLAFLAFPTFAARGAAWLLGGVARRAGHRDKPADQYGAADLAGRLANHLSVGGDGDLNLLAVHSGQCGDGVLHAGVETVDVAAGVFETFKTELEEIDGSGGRGTMWFTIKSPRVVVRSVFERRGVTITSELTSRE